MRHPINILVFRIGQIGDTIAALPSLWVLRKQFPEARIVVLSEIPIRKTHLSPETILPKTGLVDGFEKYPGGASLKNFLISWRKIRQLRKQGFDTLVYLMPSARTKKQRLRDLMFFRSCGIKRLLTFNGFDDDLYPKRSDGTLSQMPKEADSLLNRLRLDGLLVPTLGHGCMDLRITESEREKAQEWWRQNGNPKTPNGWVAVCFSAKCASKLWPIERYIELVHKLIKDHGIIPVIIGGNEDRQTAIRLIAEWGTGLCAAGNLNVRESAALMEGARFYLGNDTGTMHLAAAVDISCVAIFSARDWPGKWEPYGNDHKVLRFEVPCAGCRLASCDKKLECLTEISVQQVYDACLEIIKKTSTSFFK
jgi:ADP-heptose:LPS heptosyltransferase